MLSTEPMELRDKSLSLSTRETVTTDELLSPPASEDRYAKYKSDSISIPEELFQYSHEYFKLIQSLASVWDCPLCCLSTVKYRVDLD